MAKTAGVTANTQSDSGSPAREPIEAEPVVVRMIDVTVPLGTGAISISTAGGEALRYKEVEGIVTVPDNELDLFLTHVRGSSVTPPAAPAAKEN